MKEDVLYRFAKDNENNLIDSNLINAQERRLRKYYCLSCGKELTPVLGQIRRRHFRHEVDQGCNSETYLHELGKRMLKKRWDESAKFIVTLKQHQEEWCQKVNTCMLKSDCCGRIKEDIQVDLKKHYQECTIEKQYKGFIADLLIEDNTGKMPPIMLEVCVFHPCSEDKKNSGIRIIEFIVKSEEMACSLFNRKLSYEDDRCYGFIDQKPTDYVDNIDFVDYYGEKIVKATLFETGYIDISYVNCKDIEKTQIGNAVAIGYFHPSGGWHPDEYIYKPFDKNWYNIRNKHHLKKAKMFFAQRGFNIKSCWHCINYQESTYGNHYCWCYKKHNTPKDPHSQHAYFCNLYRTNFEEIPGPLWECNRLQQHLTTRGAYPAPPKDDPDKSIVEEANRMANIEKEGDSIYKQLFEQYFQILDIWGVDSYEVGIKDEHSSIYLRSNLNWIDGILVIRLSDRDFAIYAMFDLNKKECISTNCDASQVISLIDDYIDKRKN